jgi:signal peptidase II
VGCVFAYNVGCCFYGVLFMPMSASLRRWLLLIIIVGTVLAIDQLSKWLIINTLEFHQSIPLLPPFVYLVYSANTGAAFGFLPDAGTLFLILAFVIVIYMLFTYPSITSTVTRVAMGLVVGGALGNAVDRINHGYVVDWVHLSIPNIISNVSNFADHAIVIGVITFAIQTWREEAEEKRRRELEAIEAEVGTLHVETDFKPEEKSEQPER